MVDLMASGTHHAVILFVDQYLTLSGLVYGGVLERHPALQVRCSSAAAGGSRTGWTAWTSSSRRTAGRAAKLSLTPSEYFRRQCVISFDPGERTMGAMAASRATTTSSGRPTSRTATRSTPASSTSSASTPKTWNRPTARKIVGENAARLYGIEDLVRRDAPRLISREPDSISSCAARPSSTAAVSRRTPPTSPSATDRSPGRSRRRARRRPRSTPTAWSSRRASSTSTRTTTRSCTGNPPRRRRRGTA